MQASDDEAGQDGLFQRYSVDLAAQPSLMDFEAERMQGG